MVVFLRIIVQFYQPEGGSNTALQHKVCQIQKGDFHENQNICLWPPARHISTEPTGHKVQHSLAQAVDLEQDS